MSNKLYDLKLDWTFKNVFLNKSSFNYICYLFSILLDLNYYELMCYMKIINSELPSGVIGIKSSYSDIIFEYKELNIILKMNLSDIEYHINKNYFYLFKQHSSKRKELIYKSNLMFPLYNECLYKNIEIIHINLDYLENKYYNEDVLNEFENSMLIFIENDYYKLKKIIKRKDVQDIVEFMNGLKFNKNGIPTYDYDEFKRIEELEGIRNKEQLETERKILENEKNELENQKS